MRIFLSFFIFSLSINFLSAQKKIILDDLKAFPSAEGAGAIASGGRGGEVVYVTNLNNSGTGSLRDAILNRTDSVARTIVFAVGGRLELTSKIFASAGQIPGSNKYGNLTIAGQTANDLGGIHLTMDSTLDTKVAIRNSENIIIRYISAKGGWKLKKYLNRRTCMFDLHETNKVIVDHYSGGWGTYTILYNHPNKNATNGYVCNDKNGVQHSYKAGDFTFQYSLGHVGISSHNVTAPTGCVYSYVNSNIGESDRLDFWHNTHGASDIHHNAFILISHRQPFNVGAGSGSFVMKNNYTYGWGPRLAKHNGSSKVDYIRNIFEKGNWSPTIYKTKLLKEEFSTNLRTGVDPGPKDGQEIGYLQPSIYISGNEIRENGGTLYVPAGETQDDQWWMIAQFDGYGNVTYNTPTGTDTIEVDSVLPLRYRRDTALPPRQFPVTETPFNDLKSFTLSHAGAGIRFNADGTTYNVDSIDNKYIDYALNYTDPATLPGSNPDSEFVFPNYPEQSVSLDTFDTDMDGMPNAWEIANGLDPNTANNNDTHLNWNLSGYEIVNNAGYTDLEMYLADIAGDFHMIYKAVYYVDATNGDDSNDGLSPGSAWKTISKVNSMISTFEYGDSILFKRGETWTGSRLNIENIYGSKNNDIVFGAYGTGQKPVINTIEVQNHSWTDTGNNIWKADNPPADHPNRMLINGEEKLRANIQSELDGINFFWRYDETTNDLYLYSTTDPNGTTEIKYATEFPVIVEEAEYITLRDLDLQGGWTALFINTNSKNITLDSMNIGKYAANGVVTNTDSIISTRYPSNILIDNCTFDSYFTLDYSMAGTYSGSYARGCEDGFRGEAFVSGEIKNCHFQNWGHASINFFGGVNIKVYDNKIHHNYCTSPDICYGGRIVVDDAIRNEVFDNKIINTSVQSQLNGQNNHYHHNIFKGTKNTPLIAGRIDAGIELQAYSNQEVTQNTYENNVIANTDGPGFRISGNNEHDIHDNTVKNNIIYNCGDSVLNVGFTIEADSFFNTYDNSILNNVIFSSVTTQTCDFRGTIYDVAGFNALNGTDGYIISDNLADDPQFVDAANDNFHLQASSPCIDAGTTALSDLDYDDNPIPLMAKPDIGAYEYGIYWTGAISNDWHTAGNWSNGQVPDANTEVTIPKPEFYNYFPKVYNNTQIKKLYIKQNAKMQINNNVIFEILE